MNNPEGELKRFYAEKLDSWYELAQTMQTWFPYENYQAEITFLGNDAYRWAAFRTKADLPYGNVYMHNLLLATSEQLIVPGFSEQRQNLWSITPLIHQVNDQDQLFFYATFPQQFSPVDLYCAGYFITNYYRFAAQYGHILRDTNPEELFMDLFYLYQDAIDSEPEISTFFSEMEKFKTHIKTEPTVYNYKSDDQIDDVE